MEQYEHIDEIYNGEKKERGPLGWIMWILLITAIAGICAMVLFRIFSQKYYPAEMKELAFNQTLSAHYAEKNGEIEVYTQKIRAPYDDPDEGNFFSSHLLLIPKAEQLQVTLRYNDGRFAALQEEYGETALPNDQAFIFRLQSSDGSTYELANQSRDEALMYTYLKLTFDGVKIPLPEDCTITVGENGREIGSLYMTVDVYLAGIEEPIARLPVYETHIENKDKSGDYHLYEYAVKAYSLSKGERPE